MYTVKPPMLRRGDTIGFISPSYLSVPADFEKPEAKLRELGFGIKYAKNIYSAAEDFAGTPEERAADLNEMIADPDVKALLFGGGEVCNEILPYVDFDAVRRNPKILCSYSDSTTILNAVYGISGMVTFYGASPRMFAELTDYNRHSFEARIMSSGTAYEKSGEWRVITPGRAEGTLTGGYLVNYAAMVNGPYFRLDRRRKHILFIEDHESFCNPAMVSKWFSQIEQSGFFNCVTGLIFGHYSNAPSPLIDSIIARIGRRYGIPAVRCEDFGHGANNAVLPIGVHASLNTDGCEFNLLESAVRN